MGRIREWIKKFHEWEEGEVHIDLGLVEVETNRITSIIIVIVIVLILEILIKM